MYKALKLLLIVLLISSCNNEEEIVAETLTTSIDEYQYFGKTYINEQLNLFAQDLAVALENKYFAADIHKNIGIKFDGDYDYLLEHAMEKEYSGKGNLSKSFKSYLFGDEYDLNEK